MELGLKTGIFDKFNIKNFYVIYIEDDLLAPLRNKIDKEGLVSNYFRVKEYTHRHK